MISIGQSASSNFTTDVDIRGVRGSCLGALPRHPTRIRCQNDEADHEKHETRCAKHTQHGPPAPVFHLLFMQGEHVLLNEFFLPGDLFVFCH
ncbi:Uncharacterised protein [Vibrio cholerae]|uniref:Uncharacterized protein n=1 Tax=Vibrio cholerae TaxID=666 RepID=A0A656AXR1_VIBCL|nr:Uncharacterised protein [Vibrio cholerae]